MTVDLGYHGDLDTAPGLVDFAVNVTEEPVPTWLTAALGQAMGELARYPDPGPARAAIAARHGRPVAEVLPSAGAAEAFVLLARALRPRRPVVVHPQFTEPERALRAAGHVVRRVLLPPPFSFDPAVVPADADLVVVGNPTNPTSRLHDPVAVASLARPGRVLVVDEAFADQVPGEPASLAGRRDLPGLVVVRSLTKAWGLAGLRVGYLLGAAPIVARLAAAQPRWAVSAPALAAAAACCSPAALAEGARRASAVQVRRDRLVHGLTGLGLPPVQAPAAPFVLVRVPDGERLRQGLRSRGYAVRRGDTFPGLGPDWLRLAVRGEAVTDAFLDVLADVLGAAVPAGLR